MAAMHNPGANGSGVRPCAISQKPAAPVSRTMITMPVKAVARREVWPPPDAPAVGNDVRCHSL